MKLFTLVLALSCIIAYATSQKNSEKVRPRGHWPTIKIFTTSHRFRREAEQNLIAANLENTPQLPFDDNNNLVLFDNEPVNLDEDDNEVPGSNNKLQPSALFYNMHLMDENDNLGAYTFHPGTYGGFAQNFGMGGRVLRWRREAIRGSKPRFRFEAEK